MLVASVVVEIGNGSQAYFWTDKWINGQSVTDIAPTLLNAVQPHVCKVRTVAQGLLNNAWALDITGALTVQVIMDYLRLWDVIRQNNITPNLSAHDRFRWKWTADGQCTTASAYWLFSRTTRTTWSKNTNQNKSTWTLQILPLAGHARSLLDWRSQKMASAAGS